MKKHKHIWYVLWKSWPWSEYEEDGHVTKKVYCRIANCEATKIVKP